MSATSLAPRCACHVCNASTRATLPAMAQPAPQGLVAAVYSVHCTMHVGRARVIAARRHPDPPARVAEKGPAAPSCSRDQGRFPSTSSRYRRPTRPAAPPRRSARPSNQPLRSLDAQARRAPTPPPHSRRSPGTQLPHDRSAIRGAARDESAAAGSTGAATPRDAQRLVAVRRPQRRPPRPCAATAAAIAPADGAERNGRETPVHYEARLHVAVPAAAARRRRGSEGGEAQRAVGRRGQQLQLRPVRARRAPPPPAGRRGDCGRAHTPHFTAVQSCGGDDAAAA